MTTSPSEDELIADAAVDIPAQAHYVSTDYLLEKFDITKLPTGSLIVSDDNIRVVAFHSNDMNGHIGILLWVSDNGDDTVSLRYEPGKTRPMVLEMDTNSLSELMNPRIALVEIGLAVHPFEFAYIPQQSILDNPRYLETVSRIAKILPLTYGCNHFFYKIAHKWMPMLFPESDFTTPKCYYRQLSTNENPLAHALSNVKSVSAACVDFAMTFLSILHEELFINLTANEIASGKIAESVALFFQSPSNLAVADLLRPNSEVYRLMEREPIMLLQVKYSDSQPATFLIFFIPIIVGFLIFLAVSIILRIFIGVILSGDLRPSRLLQLPRR